jgi:hypothetical protein
MPPLKKEKKIEKSAANVLQGMLHLCSTRAANLLHSLYSSLLKGGYKPFSRGEPFFLGLLSACSTSAAQQ